MVSELLGEMLGEAFIVFPSKVLLYLLGILLIIGITAYVSLTYFNTELKSDKILTPEKVLHTDGKSVDTIYLYKLKNK